MASADSAETPPKRLRLRSKTAGAIEGGIAPALQGMILSRKRVSGSRAGESEKRRQWMFKGQRCKCEQYHVEIDSLRQQIDSLRQQHNEDIESIHPQYSEEIGSLRHEQHEAMGWLRQEHDKEKQDFEAKLQLAKKQADDAYVEGMKFSRLMTRR